MMRGGLTLAALALLLVVTAGWWALALWPLAADAPSWLLRTRFVCFGATTDGLPNAGGWILLIGEPIGMIAVLIAVWGNVLADDFRRAFATAIGRAAVGVSALALGGGLFTAVARVRSVIAPPRLTASDQAVVRPISAELPRLTLEDQRGVSVALESIRGPAVITFGFGHCPTVCPTTIHEARRAREMAARSDVALVVLTLDPWRDGAPQRRAASQRWTLADHDLFLGGSLESVNQVLDALEVARWRDARTGDVTHGVTAFLLNARGVLAYRLDGGLASLPDLLRQL
jgi:cytochrome oxidase Cu insertion factor (SCO1/SenC/PrrC family)